MSSKKAAAMLVVFIAALFLLIGVIAVSDHIPILGKPLVFVFAIILVIFVVGFFAVIARRKK